MLASVMTVFTGLIVADILFLPMSHITGKAKHFSLLTWFYLYV
jgi:hypothetical protein